MSIALTPSSKTQTAYDYVAECLTFKNWGKIFEERYMMRGSYLSLTDRYKLRDLLISSERKGKSYYEALRLLGFNSSSQTTTQLTASGKNETTELQTANLSLSDSVVDDSNGTSMSDEEQSKNSSSIFDELNTVDEEVAKNLDPKVPIMNINFQFSQYRQ